MRHLILFTLVAAMAPAKTVELKIYPPEVRFHANSEGQKVLVVATDDEGVSREVTSEVTFQVTAGQVEGNRTIKAAQPGAGRLIGRFDGLSAEAPVEVLKERPHELSFINDIVPIFTRADC